MSDGGKGSGRRIEDLEKVRSNWDLIDWGRTPTVEEAPNIAEQMSGTKPINHLCSDDVCGCVSLLSKDVK